MAAGVLIKPRAVDQKGVRRPTIGDESLEDVAEDFLHRRDAQRKSGFQGQRVGFVSLLEKDLQGFSPPTNRRKASFVKNASVERDTIQFVGMPGFSHLRDQNFDLQRLELLTEDGTQA